MATAVVLMMALGWDFRQYMTNMQETFFLPVCMKAHGENLKKCEDATLQLSKFIGIIYILLCNAIDSNCFAISTSSKCSLNS